VVVEVVVAAVVVGGDDVDVVASGVVGSVVVESGVVESGVVDDDGSLEAIVDASPSAPSSLPPQAVTAISVATRPTAMIDGRRARLEGEGRNITPSLPSAGVAAMGHPT
jgi:hypothetical protein